MFHQKHPRIGLYLLLGMILIAPGCSRGLRSSESEQVIAFVNVNLIPMTEEVVFENQSVLVEGTEIIEVGPVDKVRVPRSALVIDGLDGYLLPGLADMHMHTREDWEDPDLWPVQPLKLYLANGVTTIRDFGPTGSRIDYALDWIKEIQAGLRDGPQIFTSGKLLYASPMENPEGIVLMNADQGFDFIKLYSYLSEEDFQRGIQKAELLGIYTAGHIPFAVGLDGSLEAGLDEIAHVEELVFEFIDFSRQQELSPEEWWVEVKLGAVKTFELSNPNFMLEFYAENQDLLESISDKLLGSDAPVDTTMIVDRVVVQKNFQRDVFLNKPENAFLMKGYLESYLDGNEKHLIQCRGVEAFCAAKAELDSWILRGLYDAGVLLVLGTDAGTGGMGIVPGFSVHEELGILVENGLSPYQALETATVKAAIVAEKMGKEGGFGTIEPGKRADLLLVLENPLENLDALQDPVGVMAAGRWYSREDLNRFLETD